MNYIKKSVKKMTGKIEYDEIIAGKVFSLASFGVNQELIAHHCKISKNTLRKYYFEELKAPLVDRNKQVENTLYYCAVFDKNIPALIFLAKTQLGYREKDTDNTSIDQLKDAMLKALSAKLPD